MLLNPNETALLVVDFQPYYMRQRRLKPYFNAISFSKSLPEAVTQIWIVQDVAFKTASDIMPLDQQVEPELFGTPDIAPHALTMVKGYFSAFAGTRLLEYLDEKEIKNVMIGGLYGELCVGLTGADAIDYEFQTIMLSDMIQMHDPVDVSTECPHGAKLLPSSAIRFE